MKKKNWKLALLGMATFALITSSCSSDEPTAEEEAEQLTQEETQEEDTLSNERDDMVDDYRLPTPNDLFEVIKLIGGEANEDLMNDPANIEDYTTRRDQAINFGVYSSDIAYISTYDISKHTVEYLRVLEELANKMGISAVFDETIVNRIRSNETNEDSLYAISNDTYFKSYKYLENNEARDLLSYMLAGGWVESMYIVTNLIGDYEEGNEMIDKVADQKYVLENIIDYMILASDEYDGLMDVIDDLMSLKEIYDAAEAKGMDQAPTDVNQQDGKFTLSGGTEVNLDAESYGMIVEKIKEIRNSYTGVSN